MKWRSKNVGLLSVRKYCQFFTHESNTFLCEKYTPMGRKSSETDPSPWGMRIISNTCMLWPTPLTIPNEAWSIHTLLYNYITKSPLVTTGCHKFLPPPGKKTAPLLITTPYKIPIPRPTPLTIGYVPNGIQIQSTILLQYTFRTVRLIDQKMG